MTVKELCELAPECVKINIAGIIDDINFPRGEDILIECMGHYEISNIRPTAQDELLVFLKTQYVKRSN